MSRSNQVFFSYAREDAEVVRAYAHEFASRGIAVWVDFQEIRPGPSLIDQLNDALSACTCSVIFYSKDYAQKAWTNEERRALLYSQIESSRGDDKSRLLYVVKLDDTQLEPMLAHRIWTAGNDPKTLAEALGREFGSGGTTAEGANASPSGTTQTLSFESFSHALNDLAVEEAAIQLVAARSASRNVRQVMLELRGFRPPRVECFLLTRISEETWREISFQIELSTIHRRHVRDLQSSLARGGLGIFETSFRIEFERKVAALDETRRALRALLEAVVDHVQLSQSIGVA